MKSALFAFCLFAAGLPVSAATVVLTPSTLTPSAGSLFTVDVSVTGNTDEILGFGFNPTSSIPDRAAYQSAVNNPFFGPDLGLGDPAIAGFTFPGSTGSTVPLVVLTFLAGPQTGAVTLGISTNLSDPNQGLFFLTDATLDITSGITVTVLDAVPEPGSLSTMVLGGAGLLALLLRRRAG